MVAVDGLSGCYLFDGVPDEIMAPVHDIAEVQRFPAGALIFQENDPATHIQVLKSGLVTLSFSFWHEGKMLHVNIKRVQPGELFGWSALTRGQKLSAQARADTDVEIISIPADRLRELMDADPRLGYAVMDRLTTLASSRLHATREQLRLLLRW